VKKINILLIAAVIAALGLHAQETTRLKVKVQAANVRAEPDMSGAVVRRVELGMLLESRQKVGEWYEILVVDEKGMSISGFIHNSVVDVVGAGGAAPAPGYPSREAILLKVKLQTASLRAEPDPNGAVVKYVTAGTQLEARQKMGEWYEILVTDEKGTSVSGFIHGSVVDVVSPGAAAPAERPAQPPVVRPEAPPPAQVAYPSPTIRVPVQWPSAMIFGRYESFSPNDENFKSIYGGGSVFGGEIRLRIASALYLSVAGGYYKGTGVLTLTKEDTTTLTILPLDAMIVYHFLSGSILPYIGVGGAVSKYKEENIIGTVDEWGFGFGFCGGITARLSSFGLDARVKYTSINIKPLEDEAGLGGLTLSIGAGVLF